MAQLFETLCMMLAFKESHSLAVHYCRLVWDVRSLSNIFCKQDFRLAYQLKTSNMELLMLQLLLEICGQGYVFVSLRHLMVTA